MKENKDELDVIIEELDKVMRQGYKEESEFNMNVLLFNCKMQLEEYRDNKGECKQCS